MILFILVFLVEHSLSILNFVYGEQCYEAKEVSVTESYFLRQFDCVFNYFSYSHTLAIVLTVIWKSITLCTDH